MTYFRELVATRELLINLVAREIKGEYRRTALGQVWSLINPIATMIVFSIVFGVIFRASPPPGDPSGLDIYALWLMCGFLAWSYFARVVNGGLDSLVTSANLIQKVYFPRMHLVFAVTLATGFTWCVEMGVLVVALHIFGGFPLPWLPLVVVFMALLALFATGLALVLAIFNVHFRDTKHFIAILLQMWMYLTPIIYPIEFVQQASTDYPWIDSLFQLNPMLHFVEVFRDLLYDNTAPSLTDITWCVGAAAVTFLAGYVVFARSDKNLAELL
jgi:ABC-2 type transport system permease protein